MTFNNVATQRNEIVQSHIAGEFGVYPSTLGLQYAEEKSVYPSLHLDKTQNGVRQIPIKNRYRNTKDRKAVEFVVNFLDNCWNHEKTTQHEVGFYHILFEFNQSLNIKDRGEEIISGSRMALCYIIRYIELSGKYNESFFQKIWKFAPVEVKAEIDM